jgi:phage FluMu protein Com
MENSGLRCKTCGKVLAAPLGHSKDVLATLIDEESARCSRLREITQQRQSLAARTQAGITGMLDHERIDTIDMIAHRKSLLQLDSTLKAEAEALSTVMHHSPAQP